MKFFSQRNSLDPNQPWKDGNLLGVNADFYDIFPCLVSVCYFLMLIIHKRCTKKVPFTVSLIKSLIVAFL